MRRLILIAVAAVAVVVGCGSRPMAPVEPVIEKPIVENHVKLGVTEDRLFRLGMEMEEFEAKLRALPFIHVEGVESAVISKSDIETAAESVHRATESLRSEVKSGRETIKAREALHAGEISARDGTIKELRDENAKLKSKEHRGAVWLAGICLAIGVGTLIASGWVPSMAAISGKAFGAALAIRVYIETDSLLQSCSALVGGLVIGGIGWWIIRRWHLTPVPERPTV